jgi:hypothetical protein
MRLWITILLFCVTIYANRVYDEFTIPVSSGNVDSTFTQPCNCNMRRTKDKPANEVAITSGALVLTSTASGSGTTYYPDSIARIPGSFMMFSFKGSVASAGGNFGPRPHITGTISVAEGLSYYLNSTLGIYYNSVSTYPRVLNYTANTTIRLCNVFRNNGMIVFVKQSIWKLKYVDEYSNNPFTYFYIAGGNSGRVSTLDNLFMEDNLLYNVIPLSSDAFTRANGVMDTTDGLGHAEANGGSGDAWTARKGTWEILTNKARCSDTVGAGQKGIVTVTASANVFLELAVTRSAGVAGVVARWANDSNYIVAYHDGTNGKVDKVVNNVTTNVFSTAIAYSAGKYIKLLIDTTEVIATYDLSNIGIGTITEATLLTGTGVGIYTTDTANRFDNFVAWSSRGYSDLDSIFDTTKIFLNGATIPKCSLAVNRTVIGGGTIDTLRMANGIKVTLEAAKKLTLTVIDTGGLNGASGALDSMVSTTAAACTLSAPQCTLRYVYFKNVYSSNTIYVSDGTSINGGGNTNIVFTSGRRRTSRFGLGLGLGLWIKP